MAHPLAVKIAEKASGNFLIAGLMARTHGLYDTEPVPASAVGSIAGGLEGIQSSLEKYLSHVPAVGGVDAGRVLSALAYAEAPGLPLELWQVAIRALAGREVFLEEFAQGSAANFLLQSPGHPPAYRLFHQALSDSLLRSKSPEQTRADHRALTEAFIAYGTARQWRDTSEYLKRSLSHHASKGQCLDLLLRIPDFLNVVDAVRLGPSLQPTPTGDTGDRARQPINVARIVESLLAITEFGSPDFRDALVSLLRPDLSSVVARSPRPRADAVSLVMTCTRFPGGLSELLSAVEVLVGEVPEVSKFREAVNASIQRSA